MLGLKVLGVVALIFLIVRGLGLQAKLVLMMSALANCRLQVWRNSKHLDIALSEFY